jgi:hypothetical protein
LPKLFCTILISVVTKRVNDVRDNPRLPQKFFGLQGDAPNGTQWNGVARGTMVVGVCLVSLLDADDLVGSILFVASDV